MPRLNKTAAVAACSLLLALVSGCSGGGDEAPAGDPIAEEGATPPDGFQFSTSSSVDFDLLVQLDGNPVSGAIVQLVDVLDPTNLDALEEASLGGTFYAGVSDASGRVIAPLSLPLDRDDFDLVVDLPSATGPYDEETLRSHWGLFAPSSRTSVTWSDLSGLLVIELTTL